MLYRFETTAAICGLQFIIKDTIINDLPETLGSYASALTWYGKWYKDSTSDYLAISATNLWLDKDTLSIEKIADDQYIYEGTFICYPGGQTSSFSYNVYTPTVVDDLSNVRYESA